MLGSLGDKWMIKKCTVGQRGPEKNEQNDVMSRIIKISGDFRSGRYTLQGRKYSLIPLKGSRASAAALPAHIMHM